MDQPDKNYTIIRTSDISREISEQMAYLWNSEYPDYLTYSELNKFEVYWSGLTHPLNYLALDGQNEVVGWMTTFDRDGGRWFSMIVSSLHQRKGLGSRLIEHAKRSEAELNGWVVDHDRDKKTDGSPYISPLQFYVNNHFEVLNDIRMETKDLSVVRIRWQRIEDGKN